MVSQYTFWPVLPRLWEGSHWSLRQTYPAQQVSKARIGADVTPRRELIEREIRDIEWDWMARSKGRSTADQR